MGARPRAGAGPRARADAYTHPRTRFLRRDARGRRPPCAHSRPAHGDAPAARRGAHAQAPPRPLPRARRPHRRGLAPAPSTTWQWQLSGPLDDSVPAQLYDVDLFETSTSTVAALHARGARVICYFSAGSTTSDGRLAGERLEGWPDERWLDIRRLDVLGPIIERRLDLCARKGFDGVEPDNVDGYANRSGFPLRAHQFWSVNRFLAREAHERGLSIGLKNDLDQVRALEPHFDWALNEQCFEYRECDRLRPFTAAGKAVFVAGSELAPEALLPRRERPGSWPC